MSGSIEGVFADTSDQAMLRDAVQGLIARNYASPTRDPHGAAPPAWDDAAWRLFAAQGLIGAAFAPEQGGFASHPRDAMIVAEAFGRDLIVEPYAETIEAGTVFAGLATDGGSDRLTAIVDGAERWIVLPPGASVSAAGDEGVWIKGAWPLVAGAGYATHLLVPVRDDEGRCRSFALVADRPGVSIVPVRTIDGRRGAEIGLAVDVSQADAVAEGEAASQALRSARARAVALRCAEAVGIMRALNAATLDQLRTRQQFGVPIGSFQVLQHRLVDMTIAADEAAAITAALSAPLPLEAAAHLARLAAAKVAKGARFVGQQAIQLHGGMGMTDELTVGHYVKRLIAIRRALDGEDGA